MANHKHPLDGIGIIDEANKGWRHQMNWFKRHLNWTLFLGSCALQVAFYPLLVVFAGGASMWDFWVAFAIGILIYYGIFEWVLEKKGYKMNSGWFLLWLTGWIGIIILLLVKKRTFGANA